MQGIVPITIQGELRQVPLSKWITATHLGTIFPAHLAKTAAAIADLVLAEEVTYDILLPLALEKLKVAVTIFISRVAPPRL
jgi:hypothetical protein